MRTRFILFGFALIFSTMIFGHKIYAAELSPSLYLNGAKLSSAQPPIIIKGTTFVPLRIISESLGYDVKYSEADHTVMVQSGTTILTLKLDSFQALMNGQVIMLPSKPVVIEGSTMLPFRFVAEQFGLDVSWDAATHSVRLVDEAALPIENDDADVYPPSPDVSMPETVIENISLTDDSLTLSYLGVANYSTFSLKNPNRIVIDLADSAFANGFNGQVNWDDQTTYSGTISVKNKLVKQIRYGMYDDKTSTIRIVLDLAEGATISAQQNSVSKQIVFRLTASEQTPGESTAHKFKVVIDAGHGGKDPGASAVIGKSEKTFTMAVAAKVQALLVKDSDIEVLMTRSGDTYPSLDDRTKLANKERADVFVSIHANVGPSSAHGTEVYYRHNNSKKLASIMHDNIQDMVGFKDRGIKTANFHVIRESDMPAVLLEMGFISNVKEAKRMYSESVQQTMAEAIAKSIKQYLQR